MENHYNCIYMYINKINGKKYIGQAKNFKKRHSSHIRCSYNENSGYDYTLPFHNAIRKYGIENFEIFILKDNIKTQCLIDLFEVYYIEKNNCLVKNNKGYNISDGGNGGNKFAGKTEEEMNEIKRKISETEKGKILSDEHKRKISESRLGEKHPFYGKTFSDEHKRKLSESKLGEKNKRAKKVIQLDLNNNLIKIWNCISEAERKTGIAHQSISKCCKNKLKSAGGFKWRYIGDEENGNL